MHLPKRITTLYHNPEARTLTGNFISLTILKVVGYIFPLLTLPYLARIIGPSGFGEVIFASSIVVYFQTITDFGFNYTATRDVAQHRDNLPLISKIFCNVMIAKLLLMFLCLIIFAICIYFIPFLRERQTLMWFSFLYIPGYVLFPEWFFQAMEKMKYITIMNVVAKLIFTLLIFVVIREKADYIYQPLLVAFGFLVSGVISIWFIFYKFKIQIILPSCIEIKQTIKAGWNMFLCLFLPNLYSSFSIIILRSYGGATATGIYTCGYRFVDIIDQLTQVISRTFYPFLARRIDKHSLYVHISGLICIFASICLFFGADLLIRIFYTAEFTDSATVIRIMAISPFFLFLMNTYGPNYLVLIGKEHILRNIILYCSIFGLFLTLLITPRFGYIGIATALTLIWGIRGIITYIYAKKYTLHE